MGVGKKAVGAFLWNIASGKIREVESYSDKALEYCKNTEKKREGLAY